jgi:diaminopimelate decarboxylase
VTEINHKLLQVARALGTPVYAYDVDLIAERFNELDRLFGSHFGISYAVKANPNIALLRTILPRIETFDVSSFAEAERVIAAGCPVSQITFSGPAKRSAEVRGAVTLGIGEMVLESLTEARTVSEAALNQGRVQNVLLRINPLKVPRQFGGSMAGRASQFGVDEEVMEDAIDTIISLPGINLIG